MGRYFESVPSGCSRAEFRKLLPAEATVKAVWYGDVMVCPPPGIARPVWVLCASKEDVSLIVDQLDGSSVEYMSDIFTNDKSKWRISCRSQMRTKHSHLLPTVANRPDRIASDLASLLQILHALEKYWELDTSLEPCLNILADQVPDLSDVDRVYVLVHVLRRVFGYDYWHSAADQEFGISFHVYERLEMNSSVLVSIESVLQESVKKRMKRTRRGVLPWIITPPCSLNP